MADWIDVSDTTPRIAYTATASQTAFTVPFVFFEEADLKVYQNETLLTLATHYTTTGAEDEDGGTITLLTGATVGDEIMIVRDLAIVQTTHIPPSGPLDIPAVNIQFSKLIAIDQQLDDALERSIHFPDSDSTLSGELAPVATRKNLLLGFGDDGELIYPSGPSFVGDTATGVAIVDSLATAQVTTFDISVNVVVTEGRVSPGDGGGATYVRGVVGDTGRFQDAGGVYWKPKIYGVAVVESRATAALQKFPSTLSALITRGLVTAGDGGGANYIRGTIASSGAFADANGDYWGLDGSTSSGFVGVGDGVTDNLTALNAAIADAGTDGWRGSLYLPEGIYYSSVAPTNTKGVTFTGPGYIVLHESHGYPYRWDLRGHEYAEIEGREYLGAFHHVVRENFAARTGIKLDWLGDSTMLVNSPDYSLPELVEDSLITYGLVGPVFTNRGVSGATTEDIRTVQVPPTIVNDPHLIVLKPGHNDIYSRVGTVGGVPKTDAQILTAAALVATSLETMLATLRAATPVTRCPIILMTPNTATMTDGRDERYYETLSPMFRALARKYQCCFVDSYRIWRDARGMNTPADFAPWLDEPSGVGNGGIHPLKDFNLQMADVLTELIYPPMLRRTIAAPVSAAVTFSNGWAANASYRVRSYRYGQHVSFEGLITPGTTTITTLMLTINANHAPTQQSRFFSLATSVADKNAVVILNASGQLQVQSIPAGATFVSLDGINYTIAD